MTAVGVDGEHKRVTIRLLGQRYCFDCNARWDADDEAPSECVPLNPVVERAVAVASDIEKRYPTMMATLRSSELDEPFVASLEELAKNVDLTPGHVSYALQKDRDNPPTRTLYPSDVEERIIQQFRDAEARLGGSIQDMVPAYRSPRGVGRVYPAHPTVVSIEVRDLRALAEKYGL